MDDLLISIHFTVRKRDKFTSITTFLRQPSYWLLLTIIGSTRLNDHFTIIFNPRQSPRFEQSFTDIFLFSRWRSDNDTRLDVKINPYKFEQHKAMNTTGTSSLYAIVWLHRTNTRWLIIVYFSYINALLTE